MPAVADPFALIRVYREALAKRGTPDPFSAKAPAGSTRCMRCMDR
jgi:hypothetical protein